MSLRGSAFKEAASALIKMAEQDEAGTTQGSPEPETFSASYWKARCTRAEAALQKILDVPSYSRRDFSEASDGQRSLAQCQQIAHDALSVKNVTRRHVL